MGWPPSEVDSCSLWQFQAAAVGWARAQGGQIDAEMSDGEFAAAEALLDSHPDRTA